MKRPFSSTNYTHQMFKPTKNYNEEITDILAQLEVIEKNRGEPYKAKAYRQAVSSLSRADKKVTSVSKQQLI